MSNSRQTPYYGFQGPAELNLLAVQPHLISMAPVSPTMLHNPISGNPYSLPGDTKPFPPFATKHDIPSAQGVLLIFQDSG